MAFRMEVGPLPRAGASARRYAQAAFELGREKGNLQSWQDDIELMAAVFEDRQVRAYFGDPKRRAVEKKDSARRMFEGRVQPETLNLLLLLTERGRAVLLPDVKQRFDMFVREELGLVVAQVTTAIPVDDAERDRIALELGRLTGKRVQVETTVDPQIIGGLIARVGDKLIDGSVRTSLLQLRQHIT